MTDTNYQTGEAALRWQSSAILALQEATEAFLVHLFEDACVILQAFFLCPYAPPLGIFVLYTPNASPSCSVTYSLPEEYVGHGVVLVDFLSSQSDTHPFVGPISTLARAMCHKNALYIVI